MKKRLSKLSTLLLLAARHLFDIIAGQDYALTAKLLLAARHLFDIIKRTKHIITNWLLLAARHLFDIITKALTTLRVSVVACGQAFI